MSIYEDEGYVAQLADEAAAELEERHQEIKALRKAISSLDFPLRIILSKIVDLIES